MESKFLALAATVKEVEWLRNLILEISLWCKPIAPISIRRDSAATLAMAYSQMYNGKSRHLGVRHSMIYELIRNRVISIEFARSQQNLDDHLMKGLAKDLVIKSAEGMRLNRLKHMYLHIILTMCLEPAEKEDEVFTSQCKEDDKRRSAFQYADIFTKGLPSALFEEFRSSLSVRPPPAQTAGAY
ncbi:hypothetical protein Tco_1301900 [Tanacetum coccineum]